MSGKAVRVEIIAFFNHCPQRSCTCEEVAEALQRAEEEVEPQLDKLVVLGILDRFKEGDAVWYQARAAYSGGNGHHTNLENGARAEEAGGSHKSEKLPEKASEGRSVAGADGQAKAGSPGAAMGAYGHCAKPMCV